MTTKSDTSDAATATRLRIWEVVFGSLTGRNLTPQAAVDECRLFSDFVLGTEERPDTKSKAA